MLVQTIYDEWLMAFFNILITSLPPIAIATFERDIPEKAIEEVRMLLRPHSHVLLCSPFNSYAAPQGFLTRTEPYRIHLPYAFLLVPQRYLSFPRCVVPIDSLGCVHAHLAVVLVPTSPLLRSLSYVG